VGESRDPFRLPPDGASDVAHPFGRELLGIALERDTEPEDGGERLAEILGDEGEELVLLVLELGDGREVADDPLVPGDVVAVASRNCEHVDVAVETVGAADGQLDTMGGVDGGEL